MRITPDKLASEINDFLFRWQEAGIISDSRYHKCFNKSGENTEVTWGNDGYILKDNNFASLAEYISLVENRQYSALLSGGDLLQISFTTNRDSVVKHRLCWYPCPVNISRDAIENSSVVDAILEVMSNADLDGFHSKSPIRFDFDPNGATEEHPEVHLHMISEDCRIAVKGPLCLKRFTDFVIKHFYGNSQQLKELNAKSASWHVPDRLTPNQKKYLHLNFFEGI